MVERHARDLEVRGSNPGPGSNFSLEFKYRYYIVESVQQMPSDVKVRAQDQEENVVFHVAMR